MIITCEQCQTRFRVPAEKIPAAGTRVRCSRCQHHFFVAAEGLSVSPGPTESLVAEDRELSETGSGPATASIDFENPEFLYDPPAEPDESPEDDSFAEDGSQSGEAEGLELVPPIALEGPEHALEDPDEDGFVSEFEIEISGRSEADDDPGNSDSELDLQAVGPDSADADPGPDTDWLTGEGPRAQVPEADLLADPPAGPALEVSEDELLGFQPDPEDPDEKAEVSAFEFPMVAGASSPATRAVSGVVQAVQKGPRGRIARSVGRTRPALAAAVALGAALAAVGGWRAVAFGSGPIPGPAAVEAHGWVADDFEAFHWRSPIGARALVIRGDLYAVGAQAVPGIRVTMIDAAGLAVGDPVWAELEHLPNLRRAPASPSMPLRGSHSRDANLPPWGVTGFSLVIPDPPATARRFRLELVPIL